MTKSIEIAVTREDARTILVEILQECEKLSLEYSKNSEGSGADKIQEEYQRQAFRLASLVKEDSELSKELNRLDALYQAEWAHNTGLFERYFSEEPSGKTELEKKFPRTLELTAKISPVNVLFHFYNSVLYDNGSEMKPPARSLAFPKQQQQADEGRKADSLAANLGKARRYPKGYREHSQNWIEVINPEIMTKIAKVLDKYDLRFDRTGGVAVTSSGEVEIIATKYEPGDEEHETHAQYYLMPNGVLLMNVRHRH